jgi:AGZA family xanthine/uracil permease-like MFS transporter
MGFMSVIGSMQNIESAEAAGDRFSTRSSLAVDGLGSIVAALFGSCFPTTMYIGHPGWKGLGARSAYSSLNGLFFAAVCCTGAILLISSIIPMEAGIAIVFWIGIVITAQAFQATPREHAPAVAVGLFPAIAALAAIIIKGVAGSFQIPLENIGPIANMTANGIFSMEAGFILISMILAAISVYLIERRFYVAAVWSAVAAVLSFFGIIHAYVIKAGQTVSDVGVGTGRSFAAGYCLMGFVFYLFYFRQRRSRTACGGENAEDTEAGI